LTRFTKIAANYTEDFEAISGLSYRPYLGTKANPYGIVALVPQGISEHPLHLYELGPIAKQKMLWDIKKTGLHKNVIMLSDSASIEEVLLKPNNSAGFNFSFTELQLGWAFLLSEIYSKLTTMELNILASHRDTNKSQSCFEYAFRSWETNYQEIISEITRSADSPDRGLKPRLREKISQMAVSCEQIELKTEYTLNLIYNVIDRLKDLSNSFDGIEARAMMTMIRKISDAPKPKEGSLDEINFHEQYHLNREYLYPITEGIINIYEICYNNNLGTRKEIKRMHKACKRRPVIDSDLTCITLEKSDIDKYIQDIQENHSKAIDHAKALLRPFQRGSDRTRFMPAKRKEIIDWEVKDGRDDEPSS
jgi:hypothetical protein